MPNQGLLAMFWPPKNRDPYCRFPTRGIGRSAPSGGTHPKSNNDPIGWQPIRNPHEEQNTILNGLQDRVP